MGQGFLIPANVAAAQTAWNNYQTALAAASIYISVASYVHASATYPVTLVVESAVATQKRRQQRNR